MGEELGILVGTCTGVVSLVIFCIYTLVVSPFTEWLKIWGIVVGAVLVVGLGFCCCKKFGDGCQGKETTPTIRVEIDNILDV